jgi:hypothetical protein
MLNMEIHATFFLLLSISKIAEEISGHSAGFVEAKLRSRKALVGGLRCPVFL